MAIRHAATPWKRPFRTRSTQLRPLLSPGRRIASLGHGLLPLLPTAPQRRTGLRRLRNTRGGAGARARGRAPGVRRCRVRRPGGARAVRPSSCPGPRPKRGPGPAGPAQAGQGDPLRWGRSRAGGRGGGIRPNGDGATGARPGFGGPGGPGDLRPPAAAVGQCGGGAVRADGEAGLLSWAGPWCGGARARRGGGRRAHGGALAQAVPLGRAAPRAVLVVVRAGAFRFPHGVRFADARWAPVLRAASAATATQSEPLADVQALPVVVRLTRRCRGSAPGPRPWAGRAVALPLRPLQPRRGAGSAPSGR